MASVNTYLNFNGNAEDAFNFYKSIFGGEFVGGRGRLSDLPPLGDMPPIAENLKNEVMHVA